MSKGAAGRSIIRLDYDKQYYALRGGQTSFTTARLEALTLKNSIWAACQSGYRANGPTARWGWALRSCCCQTTGLGP
jgi:hypothetical protein